MAGAWLREEQADLAAEKILTAASRAFVDLGVTSTGMGDIARYAGCSRGTLYRYFKNRQEFHLAYVNHSAMQIAARVELAMREISDPKEQVIACVLLSIREVRDDPGMSAWFNAGQSGFAARMSRGSEVIEALADGFMARLLPANEDDPASGLRARWLVRVIVSLLQVPGENAAEEHEMVERFVVPGVLEASETGA